MIEGALFVLALVTALGCGLVAGIFFAFSTFVMKALGRLPAAQGIAAMQSINVAVINPAFMTAFMGTAVACVAVAIAAVIDWGEPFAGWLLASSVLYLVGTILTTFAYHVPRNDALETVQPTDPGAESHWARYVPGWTAWNHLRTAAALAAAAALSIALHVS